MVGRQQKYRLGAHQRHLTNSSSNWKSRRSGRRIDWLEWVESGHDLEIAMTGFVCFSFEYRRRSL